MHLTELHEDRREQAAATKSSALLIDRPRKCARHHDPCKKREMFISSDTPIPIRLSIKKSFEHFRIVINPFCRARWLWSESVLARWASSGLGLSPVFSQTWNHPQSVPLSLFLGRTYRPRHNAMAAFNRGWLSFLLTEWFRIAIFSFATRLCHVSRHRAGVTHSKVELARTILGAFPVRMQRRASFLIMVLLSWTNAVRSAS